MEVQRELTFILNRNVDPKLKFFLNNNMISTVVIKPSFECNMHCTYCYEKNKSTKKDKINFQTLKNVFEKVACYNKDEKYTNIVWHGGEPLLMGLDFFQEVSKLQASLNLNHKLKNIIQTNGVLLSEEYGSFFSSNNFIVSISLDGPPIIQDKQRYLFGEKPSSMFINNALKIMKKYELYGDNNNISVNSVFTKNTLYNIEGFYSFIKKKCINIQINPILIGNNNLGVNDLRIRPQEYAKGMIWLFDKWISEKKRKFSIEPFVGIIKCFATGKPHSCYFSDCCFDRHISIDTQGNIIPCGRWDISNYNYGNINDISIEEALNSRDCNFLKNKISYVLPKCRKCEYVEICHGGCPYSAFVFNHSLAAQDYYCIGYKSIFDHIKKSIIYK
jgi:serine-type anaerobic sulfatase-maturating enzyme